MFNEKIAALIPVYNGKDYLNKALESIYNQTYPISRVIVVDDGSTDETISYLKKYHSSVELISQKNKGPAAARNHALGLKDIDWIAYLDADDWWEPDKTQMQLEFAKQRSIDFLWCNGFYANGKSFKPINNHKTIISDYKIENGVIGRIFGFKKRNAFSFPSASFINQDALISLNGFNEEIKYSNDYDLFVRAYCENFKIGFMKERLFNYFISSNENKMTNQTKDVIESQHKYWHFYLKNYVATQKPNLIDDFIITRNQIDLDQISLLAKRRFYKQSFDSAINYNKNIFHAFFVAFKGITISLFSLLKKINK